MLLKAIALDFKILPGSRLGKLINPNIKSEWYYIPGDYLKLNEGLKPIDDLLNEQKVGNVVFYDLLNYENETIKPLSECIADYNGKIKRFHQALSERCDGDTVKVHINYGIDIFCTNDYGKNTGRSVLSPDIAAILSERFQFRKMNPAELRACIQNNQ